LTSRGNRLRGRATIIAYRFLVLAATVGVALAACAPGAVGAQTTTTVQMGDLWFCDPSFQNGVCETTVTAGDTVEWVWVGSQPHTTTECAGDLDSCGSPHLWDSPVQTGGTFSFTFDAPGAFLYRCQVHLFEMRGVITVLAPQPTPTPTPTRVASPTPGPTPTPTQAVSPTPASPAPAAVPNGGGPPRDESAWAWASPLLIAGSVLAFAGAGLARTVFRR